MGGSSSEGSEGVRGCNIGGVLGWGVGAAVAELAELAATSEWQGSDDGDEAGREPTGALVGVDETTAALQALLSR